MKVKEVKERFLDLSSKIFVKLINSDDELYEVCYKKEEIKLGDSSHTIRTPYARMNYKKVRTLASVACEMASICIEQAVSQTKFYELSDDFEPHHLNDDDECESGIDGSVGLVVPFT